MLSNLAVIKMNDRSVSTFACPPSLALIAIILLRQVLASIDIQHVYLGIPTALKEKAHKIICSLHTFGKRI